MIEIVIENEFCPFSCTANLHYEKFSDGSIRCIEIEIPYMEPNGWCWCKIDTIAFVTKLAGFEYTKYIAPNLCEKGIPLFKGKNVQNGEIVYEFESFIPERISDELIRSQINRKCILTPYVGTIGNIGIHDRIEKFHLGSNVGKIEIYNKNEILLEEYVVAYLRSTFGGKELTKHMKATAQASISIEAIRDVYIPIPPSNEQQRLVCKLHEILNSIEGIDDDVASVKQLIEKAKSSILNLAIRGKLVPQDPDDEPATMLLERIRREKEELIKAGKLKKDKRESVIFRGEDNSYYEKLMGSSIEKQIKIPFDLPNGWVWGRGRDCFSGMTNTIPTGIDFDYIDIDSIDNREHKITKPKHLNVSDAPSRAKRAVYTGSVLFSLVRPYLQNIARVSEKHKDCIASTGFYVCNSNGVLSSEYLFYLMISPYVINGLNQFMKGDNSPSINKDDIENWLYPIPPLKEQKRITYQIEKLLTQLTKIASALK